ncbi:MAG: hypothetical protein H0W88_05700 [Parachlamydiaceae bacterium]|nr:hypothetical protein [Parachlamydiaceae bacterium]
MKLNRYILTIVCVICSHLIYGNVLNASPVSNFITRIQSIVIPSYPGAYNPTFIENENGYLMAFRHDKYKLPMSTYLTEYYQHISLVQLNLKFKPISKPILCKELGNYAYDPRLIRVNNVIYMTFTSPLTGAKHSCLNSRICLTQIYQIGNRIKIDFPMPLNVKFQNIWEKNWIPFDYQNNLLLTYSISPHFVLNPSLYDGFCPIYSCSNPTIQWNYGTIRGGTPAVLVDGEYLAIFHSAVNDPVTKRYTYYLGAYTFEAEPPFRITKISAEPFSHPDFYTTPPCPLTTARVLFASGLVVRDNSIFVCYGENDCAIKVMEINKNALYESLVHVHNQTIQ